MKAKAALVVLTKQGLGTARHILENWRLGEKPDLWVHQNLGDQQFDGFMVQSEEKGSGRTVSVTHLATEGDLSPNFFWSLKDIVPRLWSDCSLLIFIMATGIVVRQIAPYIQSKDRDPAVLVLDEKGEFVISLLSGHLGGANAWAKTVAHWLNAQPVITTATDVQGLTAPDEYARRFSWNIEPVSGLKQVNRFLLDQGYLKVWTDCLPEEHFLRQDRNYFFLEDQDKEQAHIWITTKEDQARTNPLRLIPRMFCIGVGCRKGASKEQIIEAIDLGLRVLGISSKSIRGLHSISLKADETGIIEAAQTIGVPFRTFSTEEIQVVNEKQGLIPSEYVKEKIGVDGVCEAASLLGTQQGELVLPKQKLNGVTVAISKERFL